MKKILKFLLIIALIIAVLEFVNLKCFAVVDMNLTSNSTNQAFSNNNITDTNNNADNSNDTYNDNDEVESQANNKISSTSAATNTSSATVSSLSSLPESDLGLTNILNILLITIGVLIILLGIAILIKLKK